MKLINEVLKLIEADDTEKQKFKSTVEQKMKAKGYGPDVFSMESKTNDYFGDHFELNLGDVQADQSSLDDFLDTLSEIFYEMKSKKTYKTIHPNWVMEDGEYYITLEKTDDDVMEAENKSYGDNRDLIQKFNSLSLSASVAAPKLSEYKNIGLLMKEFDSLISREGFPDWQTNKEFKEQLESKLNKLKKLINKSYWERVTYLIEDGYSKEDAIHQANKEFKADRLTDVLTEAKMSSDSDYSSYVVVKDKQGNIISTVSTKDFMKSMNAPRNAFTSDMIDKYNKEYSKEGLTAELEFDSFNKKKRKV